MIANACLTKSAIFWTISPKGATASAFAGRIEACSPALDLSEPFACRFTDGIEPNQNSEQKDDITC
ncbi:MAG: hypothetical protein R3D52_12185 [Xanthobacteraceae bacterium]